MRAQSTCRVLCVLALAACDTQPARAPGAASSRPAAGAPPVKPAAPAETSARAASVVAAPTAPPQARCDMGEAPACVEVAEQLHAAASRDGAGAQRARELFRQACEAKAGRGCSKLGAIYARGDGAQRDLARAAGYSQAGCDLDDALGCVNLGRMHELGDGAPKDAARARALYGKACTLQDGLGCRRLGELYAAGFPELPRSPGLAMGFARKACALRDGGGCGNVGMNLQVGFGATADPQEAARFYRRACDLGEQRFCELLQRFAQRGSRGP